jgi:hypothetical protein
MLLINEYFKHFLYIAKFRIAVKFYPNKSKEYNLKVEKMEPKVLHTKIAIIRVITCSVVLSGF